nr:hypothetical protein [Rhizobium leguminosarum]
MMKKPIATDFIELERCYDQLMSWCDVLHAIADFLPCHIDEGLCERISDGLLPLLQTTHGLEERLISSELRLILDAAEEASAVERLRAGRLFGHGAARDVVITLETLGEGRCRLSWEAVGYQLRSFFCSTRSHVRFAREMMGLVRRAMGAATLEDAADQTEAA